MLRGDNRIRPQVLAGSSALPGFRRVRETYGMHDTGLSDIRDAGGWGADSAELTQFDPASQWVTTDYRVGIDPSCTLGKQLLNSIGKPAGSG